MLLWWNIDIDCWYIVIFWKIDEISTLFFYIDKISKEKPFTSGHVFAMLKIQKSGLRASKSVWYFENSTIVENWADAWHSKITQSLGHLPGVKAQLIVKAPLSDCWKQIYYQHKTAMKKFQRIGDKLTSGASRVLANMSNDELVLLPFSDPTS